MATTAPLTPNTATSLLDTETSPTSSPPDTNYVLEDFLLPTSDLSSLLNIDLNTKYTEIPLTYDDEIDDNAQGTAAEEAEDAAAEKDIADIIKKLQSNQDVTGDNKSSAVPSNNAKATPSTPSTAPLLTQLVQVLRSSGLVDASTALQTEMCKPNVSDKLNFHTLQQGLKEIVGAKATTATANDDAARQLAHTQNLLESTISTYVKLKKQRNYHRMHHKRVQQEKAALINDLKRLRKVVAEYQPLLQQLQSKYQSLVKDKNLLKLEKEKLLRRIKDLTSSSGDNQTVPSTALFDRSNMSTATQPTMSSLQKATTSRLSTAASPTVPSTAMRSRNRTSTSNTRNLSSSDGFDALLSNTTKAASKTAVAKQHPNDSALPAEWFAPTKTPHDLAVLQPYQLINTINAHTAAVSAVAVHPTKPIAITVSDDQSWKLWNLVDGDCILEAPAAHSDWIGSTDFHPSGQLIGTTSGDCTLKIWDLAATKCVATLSEHTAAVWDLAFHGSGNFVLSCSMDHTARLWDLNSTRCRQTFRGHVDCINAIQWQHPASHVFVTASADKTCSLWDIRASSRQRSNCITILYGHGNAVLSASFNAAGNQIVSSDTDGVIKVWDIRQNANTMAHVVEPVSLGHTGALTSKVIFHPNQQYVIAATDSNDVKIFDVLNGRLAATLQAHTDTVQGIGIDSTRNAIVSVASDKTCRIWANC